MRLLLTMPPDASGTVAPGEVAELMAAVGILDVLDRRMLVSLQSMADSSHAQRRRSSVVVPSQSLG